MEKANHIFWPRGFTLIELIITVALAAIILSVGIPSFQQTIEQNQLTSQINLFTASLHLARSESVKRGRSVSVCGSSDGINCNNAGYEAGWIVYAENAITGSREADEELLVVNNGLNRDLSLKGSPAISNSITFTANGQASSAGTFALCKLNDATKSREINILITGRIKINTQTANCTPL